MSVQYAKDQPAGFVNRLERIAIVGATGTIGSNITRELLASGKHTVTAITRGLDNKDLPAGLQVSPVDYDNHDSIVSALKNQQMLIISLPGAVYQKISEKLIAAAAEVGVEWIIPNSYGPYIVDKSFGDESLCGQFFWHGTKAVEEAGMKWMTLACGFWYDFSLAAGPQTYGFDFANKKVTWLDNGKGEKVKINTSTLAHCGEAVAKVLGLPLLPEDGQDGQPTVSNWANKDIRTAQYTVTQRDMLDSVNRVTGRTDADWEFDEEDPRARWARGMDLLKQGIMAGFQLVMYGRVWYEDQPGDFKARFGTDDEALGLRTGDVDEGTRKAMGLVENWTHTNYGKAGVEEGKVEGDKIPSVVQ